MVPEVSLAGTMVLLFSFLSSGLLGSWWYFYGLPVRTNLLTRSDFSAGAPPIEISRYSASAFVAAASLLVPLAMPHVQY